MGKFYGSYEGKPILGSVHYKEGIVTLYFAEELP
jgi:hypothetical protein